MDRFRTAHTPMDYEYSNGTGPIDENSPFITASRNAQSKKRAYGNIDSPTKQTPSLRPPASQSFLFSQPSSFSNYATNTNNGRRSPEKTLPVVPEHLKDPKYATPRKLDTTFDFSSGGDTPETPGDADANNADSEATPESSFMSFRNRTVNFMAGGKSKNNASPTKSPTKERKRGSWLNGISRALGSPGKEMSMSRIPYSDKAEKRVMKRRQQKEADRRRGGGRSRRNGEADSDDETNGAGKANGNGGPGTDGDAGGSIIAAIFSYIESHPHLPHILSYYAQLILNFFFVGCIIFIVYSFWSAIQGDVNIEADRAFNDALAEMAVCARNYRENRCEPDTRVPAMDVICTNWEKCMSRDPKAVGRARVSAHTFATIFNSFIEPISYKAMLFCLLTIGLCLFINNFAFTKFRSTHPLNPHDPNQQFHQQPQWQQPQHFGGVPPTPQRYPSGGNWATPAHMIGGFYQTPAHHQHGMMGYGHEPMPSQTPGGQGQMGPGDGNGSPIKRLQY